MKRLILALCIALGLANVASAGQYCVAFDPCIHTMVGATLQGGPLTLTQGAITADAPQISGTVTWNNASTTFTAWKLNVTDTNSASASLLIDLQVGGATKFNVNKSGVVTAPAYVATASAITIADSGGVGAAAYTLIPMASVHGITCNDADGCNVTMSETGMVPGFELRILNIGTNTVNFADTAGVSELAGAFAAGANDSITMVYGVDRWVETARSNN